MIVQPSGLWLGSDENECCPSVQSPTLAGLIILDDERSESVVANQLPNLVQRGIGVA
jgi:hypothetical protein